jgi:cytoskeletal protein CcmA (bactofilin family)
MGWFDNEQQDGSKPAAPTPQSTPPPRPAAQSPTASGSESGSTLGRQIHIDGTIRCDEDLTILGRVDGTIHAKGTLVIAKEADVRAKIDGQRVMVHGKVRGNVQGTERVTLGQTGHLTGNIETPTLEIIEGARFKGNVEMKQARSEPAAKPAPAPAPAAKKQESPTGGAAKPAGEAEAKSEAAKQATS